MTPGEWSIFIDIEGFSAIYRVDETKALLLLARLVNGIRLLGTNLPKRDEERLFIHQMGDGFLIVSDFPEPDLRRPIAVGISLMHYLLRFGGVCRAGVSAGRLADVTGCLDYYGGVVLNQNACIRLPNGVMHLFPVMGTALINSFKAQSNHTKGPLLFVDPKLRPYLRGLRLRYLRRNSSRVVVDWVSSRLPDLEVCFKALEMDGSTQSDTVALLKNYVEREPVSARWKQNAMKMIESATLQYSGNC